MKTKTLLLLGLAIVLVWLGYWIGMGLYFRWEWGKSGTLGDTFGALNTLFTGLALAGVVATLIQQSDQTRQTKQELEEERKFRLRLDLFGRRFGVYVAVREFIGDVSFGNIGQQQFVRLDVAREEAFFLFAGDSALLAYLDELRKKAGDFVIWKEQSKGQGVGSEESKRRDQISDWFHAELSSIRERFQAHLSFH